MWERWLIRAARWAHRPPSWQRVKLVLGIIAAVLALAAVERFIGWPDWLRAERVRPRKIERLLEERARRQGEQEGEATPAAITQE
ncbi:MAG: hypothetical protein D6832_06675 [Alphaproteobacteria bacterium]|nr:MAG: hypothetical protein D6832_06675 [Alphaproteobacteria bacterium]